jgi:hypothetical protein
MHFTRFNPRKAAARCIATFFCIVIFLFAAKGTSQLAGTGSIQGIITDNTEAVIQNASVTVTNTATLVQHMGNTDANGLYSFPNLPIGIYTIEVAAPSFEHYRQSNVVLEVGSSISINIKMTVGGAVQEVEVHASDLALQTEDSSFKQTIDEKTASELPLNGRQITSLITLSGASANANENSDMQGSKTFYSSVVISVGGGQGDQTDYRLDGGDHNDYMTNLNLPFPFPDAIAEFSVVCIQAVWSTWLPAQARTSGTGQLLNSFATTTSMRRTFSPPRRTPFIKINMAARSVEKSFRASSSSSPDISAPERLKARL